MSKSLRIKQTLKNVIIHASIIIRLYSLVNGPLQIAVNLTITPFFIQTLNLLWFLCMYVCFKLSKIHNLLIIYYMFIYAISTG